MSSSRDELQGKVRLQATCPRGVGKDVGAAWQEVLGKTAGWLKMQKNIRDVASLAARPAHVKHAIFSVMNPICPGVRTVVNV